MWIIPPIVGQKVMLDPSGRSYGDFTQQSGGGDGYIIKIEGHSHQNNEWLKNGTENMGAFVLWEKNGRVNRYNPNALLAIDTFKIIERVEYMSGTFHEICTQVDKDYIDERVIVLNDDIKHYDSFDKQKRLDVLNKIANKFDSLPTAYKDSEHTQMRYMGTLEEIERTKRTEPTVLFLEGESPATPKKHQGQPSTYLTSFEAPVWSNEDHRAQFSPYGVNLLQNAKRIAEVDTVFFNPCVELELAENDED